MLFRLRRGTLRSFRISSFCFSSSSSSSSSPWFPSYFGPSRTAPLPLRSGHSFDCPLPTAASVNIHIHNGDKAHVLLRTVHVPAGGAGTKAAKETAFTLRAFETGTSTGTMRSRSGRRSRGSAAAPAGPALDEAAALDSVRRHAITAPNRPQLNRRLLEAIPATTRFVLIGEASHGTKEFYDQRAELTKLLVQERGFTAVVVESDWPDAFRVNRYVRGLRLRDDSGEACGGDESALEALSEYKRFPRWMWHNRSVESFVEWLRNHNLHAVRRGCDSATDVLAAAQRCGFYGMDVYSLHSSADAVLSYLRQADPDAARVVEARYHCFDRYGADVQSYGLATSLFHKASCEDAVNRALYDIRRRIESYRAAPDGPANQEEALAVEANAMVVSGAEAYYRNMFTRDEVTWNLRDTHFFKTVQLLEGHLLRLQLAAAAMAGGDSGEQAGPGGQTKVPVEPKMVLWAHNSHLGDARHTDAGWRRGQLNIGQLVRQEYGDQVVSVGFTTHTGRVTAADEWGEPAQHKKVRPSLPGSYEHLMHSAVGAGLRHKDQQQQQQHQEQEQHGGGAISGLPPVFALNLRNEELAARLQGPLLERAIGVIYRPDTELQSHYFDAVLPRQFDFLIHADVTSAVVPIEPGDEWAPEPALEVTHGDMPELWPTGV